MHKVRLTFVRLAYVRLGYNLCKTRLVLVWLGLPIEGKVKLGKARLA